MHRIAGCDDIGVTRGQAHAFLDGVAGAAGYVAMTVGRRKPQLVGFNSVGSDLPIIMQQAVIKGISAVGFCRRPEKPWYGCA